MNQVQGPAKGPARGFQSEVAYGARCGTGDNAMNAGPRFMQKKSPKTGLERGTSMMYFMSGLF